MIVFDRITGESTKSKKIKGSGLTCLDDGADGEVEGETDKKFAA